MKILFCLGSMTKGGAERVVANLSNWLIKKHNVAIVVTPPDKSLYELDSDISFMTLDYVNDKKDNIIFRNIKRIKRLNKYIKDFDPDIILSFLPEPSYRVLFLKPIDKKKIIVSVRNDPKIEYKSLFNKMIMKILYSRADGFVFQTEEAREYFSKKIQERSIVIPNPINPDFICKPFDGIRDKSIVTVGRLEKQKNHKLLIDSFYLIKDEFKNYKLLIYGTGSLEKELKGYVKYLKLDKLVVFKGQTNNVKDEIYKSGLFVLSSDYEGMPNALMEAMAMGIPCISTDCPCGGASFLINDGENGFLVPVGDKEQLAEKMKEILLDTKLSKKFSTNSSKISKIVDPKVINDKWFDYINEVLTK